MSNASPSHSSTSGDSFNIKAPRLPPDVNARNLRIEKQRRERFNETLLDMARLVPSLASMKRPSKKVVVCEAVRHLQQRRDMCIHAARDIRHLLAENHRLTSELNAMRSQLPGGSVTPLQTPRTPSEALLELMGVEDEPCGDFPDGFAINVGSRRPLKRQEMSDMPTNAERPGLQQTIYPVGEQLSDPTLPDTSCFADNMLNRSYSPAHVWAEQTKGMTGPEEFLNLLASSNASKVLMPQPPNHMAKFDTPVDSNMINQPNGPPVSLEDIFIDPALHTWIDEINIDTWPVGLDNNASGF
ncbi:unnamed protein product [Clonostachys byssicola]|uniref:BHLH domain-containing protein n=1 Tax=Clonostachys byssicola TaxID=160290 RepID=A0A9N9UBN4_9HYPO|nr:unnamed protein product [Clonostachys byssicola]